MNILDLGCGSNKYPGSIGVDRNRSEKDADVIVDVETTPLPFPDNYFDEVRCNQFLEHVRNIYVVMDETYRVLKPGGSFYITVPYYTSIHQSQDPTHVRAFSEATFDPNTGYFNAKCCAHPYLNELTGEPFTCVFDTTLISYGGLKQPWIGRTPEEIEFARRHFWNVYGDIHVVLRADKT